MPEYKIAAELKRLHRQEVALIEWLDKTEWVQQTAQAGELGRHRADVLKQRIENLQSLANEMLSELYVYRASEYLKDVTQHFKNIAAAKNEEKP
jgi:hypothetical protein